ncbi:MAG: hypothetical protein GWO41_11315 [candidate division Zixibacteria bacterium]|nr:hypothetical protein [candidate division Zixibacteria bacterium]NIR67749.1 hypothetical protein [candidate division Zixibacteria bacterium]NIS16891.1 hypothetical protein [candidate division Zixibacteria bacterium]NIS49004.1 hypothetical protein [candidate division Zixibacteria bacterium]NIT53303.1 hypothetical protein [candidate division Zixibacteria bacterium]
MRCKKILIFALILLFLAVQAPPLFSRDEASDETQIINPQDNDADDGDGDGEEHPWQDNDDGDGTFSSFSKNIQALISLLFGTNEVEKKQEKEKQKEKKSSNTRKSKTQLRKYK